MRLPPPHPKTGVMLVTYIILFLNKQHILAAYMNTLVLLNTLLSN